MRSPDAGAFACASKKALALCTPHFRQGHASEQRVLERAAYTLMRERWLQRNESRLLAMAERWPQAR
jgi:hypothetical protein